jgi:hypothetical protein
MLLFWTVTFCMYAAPVILGEAFVLLVAAVAVVMNKINKIYGGL